MQASYLCDGYDGGILNCFVFPFIRSFHIHWELGIHIPADIEECLCRDGLNKPVMMCIECICAGHRFTCCPCFLFLFLQNAYTPFHVRTWNQCLKLLQKWCLAQIHIVITHSSQDISCTREGELINICGSTTVSHPFFISFICIPIEFPRHDSPIISALLSNPLITNIGRHRLIIPGQCYVFIPCLFYFILLQPMHSMALYRMRKKELRSQIKLHYAQK